MEEFAYEATMLVSLSSLRLIAHYWVGPYASCAAD